MYLTINNNSGGNHGHQIKDVLGGMTIAKVFGLKYIHTPYRYLDFFGFGHKERQLEASDREEVFDKVIKITGPTWYGFDSYVKAKLFFSPFLAQKSENTLFVAEFALRIFPSQTLPWYQKGFVKRDIFKEIVEETTNKFSDKHAGYSGYFDPNDVNIAMHINRGKDYDKDMYPEHFKSSGNLRYMFPMKYYLNIYHQLNNVLSGRDPVFHIYTEKLHSEDIIAAFEPFENVIFHIGDNRENFNFDQVHDIFYHFVKADILVASNSSFSANCMYFRKNRITIYHPHQQFYNLPETDLIKTDEDGNFDTFPIQNQYFS